MSITRTGRVSLLTFFRKSKESEALAGSDRPPKQITGTRHFDRSMTCKATEKNT
jgi:hypothetical protein